MTVARELAEFLTRVGPADLPAQAVDHAAMLIASTLASAALGAGIESSVIIRDLARDRGGSAEASLWFDAGAKLPVAEAAQVNAVMSDAAASDDSDLRNIVHAGTILVATAQPRLFPCGRGGRSRVLVGASDRRQDCRPGHSSTDRQSPGRAAADRERGPLSAGGHSHDSRE